MTSIDLFDADRTTRSPHGAPRSIDGYCVPGPEELDPGQPIHLLALQHARVFKTLFGLDPGAPPLKPPSAAVIEAYEGILHRLIERKVPIAFSGISNRMAGQISLRSVKPWHSKAMAGLVASKRCNSWPDLTLRLLVAYGRAGYLDPNTTRFPRDSDFASDSPLERAFECQNFWAAAGLLELGADIKDFPRSGWVGGTTNVEGADIPPGDFGALLDANCSRGEPARAAIDRVLMELAIKDQQSRSQMGPSTLSASPVQTGMRPPEVVVTAAPVRRRGL